MWAGADKAPRHIAPAAENGDSFYPTRPLIYYTTDILRMRKVSKQNDTKS